MGTECDCCGALADAAQIGAAWVCGECYQLAVEFTPAMLHRRAVIARAAGDRDQAMRTARAARWLQRHAHEPAPVELP